MIDPNENWDDPNCLYNVNANVSRNERAPVYNTRETWDCSLGLSETTRNEGEEILNVGFQTQLNFGNVFKNCKHSVVTVNCPCRERRSFLVCNKCCTVFCCKPCAEGLDITYPKAATTPTSTQRQNPEHNFNGRTGNENPYQVPRKSVYTTVEMDHRQPSASAARSPSESYNRHGHLNNHNHQHNLPVDAQQQFQASSVGVPKQVASPDTAQRSLLGSPPPNLPRLSPSPNKSGQVDRNSINGGGDFHGNVPRPYVKKLSFEAASPECHNPKMQSAVLSKVNDVLGNKQMKSGHSSPQCGINNKESQKVVSKVEVPPCAQAPPLEFGVEYKAACCWAGSPWDVGFNLINEIKNVDSLCNITLDNSWKEIVNPRTGDLCMAPFDVIGAETDVTRYRGQVLENSPSMDIAVLFLDYGNVARVAKKDLRAMPTELLNYPPLARRIKLANVIPVQGQTWPTEAKQEIEELISEKPCEVVLHSLIDGPAQVYTATVTRKGQDVGILLVKKGLAKEYPVQAGGVVHNQTGSAATGPRSESTPSAHAALHATKHEQVAGDLPRSNVDHNNPDPRGSFGSPAQSSREQDRRNYRGIGQAALTTGRTTHELQEQQQNSGSQQRQRIRGTQQPQHVRGPQQPQHVGGPQQPQHVRGPDQLQRCQRPQQPHHFRGPQYPHQTHGIQQPQHSRGPPQDTLNFGPQQLQRSHGGPQQWQQNLEPRQERQNHGPEQQVQSPVLHQQHQNRGYSFVGNSPVFKATSTSPPPQRHGTKPSSVSTASSSGVLGPGGSGSPNPGHPVHAQHKLESSRVPSVASKVPDKLLPAEITRTLPLMAKFQMVVSFVNDLNDFYAIKVEDIVKRRDMNQHLSTAADFSSVPYQPNIHKSRFVSVRTEKYKWVRGFLLKMIDQDCIVRLLDYGEVIKLPLREVKFPPRFALVEPPYAFHCCMDILPAEVLVNGEVLGTGAKWDSRIVDRLRGLGDDVNIGACKGVLIRCVGVKDNDGLSVVELQIPGRDLTWGKELVGIGLAKCMHPDWTERGTAGTLKAKSNSTTPEEGQSDIEWSAT